MRRFFEPLITSLALHSRSATSLVTTTYFIQNAIRLVSTVVLTRLLAPDAYAVMGVVTSFAFIVTMLTDVGFHSFMLKHKKLNERAFRDTMWTIRLLRSCALATFIFIVAEPVGTWLQKPDAIIALRFFSITFIIDGIIPISNITALADNRLKNYCLSDIAVSLINFSACIVIAMNHGGVLTLVYAGIISSFFRVLVFRFFLPDSFLVWSLDMDILKEVMRFGRYIVGSSVITLFVMQIDKIGVARLLESKSLGAYFLAVNIAMVPRGLANALASKSLYPSYSRSFSGASEMSSEHLYKSRIFIDIAFPAACLLGMLLSPILVSFLYDKRYEEVSGFLGILLFGLVPILWNLAINEYLVAGGWISTTLRANLVRLTWTLVVAVPFLFQRNIIAFLTALSLMEYVAYLYYLYFLKKVGLAKFVSELVCIVISVLALAIFAFLYFSDLMQLERFPHVMIR